jgi:Secretion system C-terminal sorting domain
MKTNLQITVLSILFMMTATTKSVAQATQFDDAINGIATWNGYYNFFNPSNNAYISGNSTAIANIKSVYDAGTNQFTLYPNYDQYATNNDGAGLGNKIYEGNTYVDRASTSVETHTFTGKCISNTLTTGYAAIAFIKVFAPGYASLTTFNNVPLVAGENFTITVADIPSGVPVQYGFAVTGLNGNPVDEVANGNVVVGTVPVLGTKTFATANLKMYPNPATNNVTIDGPATIEKVSVMNVLGQEVMTKKSDSKSISLDVSNLKAGAYFVKATTNGAVATSRIIKK